MNERHNRKGAGREQVLSTATRLFIDRGAANVGVNEVTAAAGVARMTLYNNFPSKEALIAEVYRTLAEQIMQNLTEVAAQKRTEEEKVLSLFDQIGTVKEGWRGCPMIHASLQAEESLGEIYDIVRSYKRKLRAFIFDQLDQARFARDELADQLLLLLDGLATQAYLDGAVSPVSSAKQAVKILLRNMP